MPLPSLIEVVPLAAPLQAEVTVPGSKSLTNRALILAALSPGRTVLEGALWSEDTQVMVECLKALGFVVEVAADPHEESNRVITVQGRGAKFLEPEPRRTRWNCSWAMREPRRGLWRRWFAWGPGFIG